MRTHDNREQSLAPESVPNDMSLALIEEQADRSIRRIWHDDRWFFSIIDVIGLLTDAPTPRTYWAMMKERIQSEGFRELLTKCERLKMTAADGKQRLTDAADTETLLRIIQSVPSPKAEPVKQWLARVGAQRLDEMTQPLPAPDVRRAIANLPMPGEDAPALALAHYYRQLASLYERQAAYEAQLAEIQDWRGHIESRLEEHEAVLSLVPEILERLGPQTLTPEHQATVKAMVARLHTLSSIAFGTIYADLNTAFHVARYNDIPDARWQEVTEWFQRRLAAAKNVHHR